MHYRHHGWTMHNIPCHQVGVGKFDSGLGTVSSGSLFWSMSTLPPSSTRASTLQDVFANTGSLLLMHPTIAERRTIFGPNANMTSGYTTSATITSWESVGTMHRFNHNIKNSASRACWKYESWLGSEKFQRLCLVWKYLHSILWYTRILLHWSSP